jgi:hypothetical protein
MLLLRRYVVHVCVCANREKRERFCYSACSITVIADML